MSDNNSILSAIADFRKENKINWDANNNRWDTNVQKLKQVQEDIKKTNQEISLIKEQFAAVTSKCDSVCQSVDLLRQDNSKLRKELDEARGEINDLQQHTRKNNILVSGVPLTKGENMFTVLDAVARAINVSFNEWDICAAHRLPNRNIDANMPPSIVVNFTSRFTKSSWLTARRLKGLFTIGANSGEIRTAKPLTGKGRAEHYSLTLRAQDGGQPSLFTDVGLKLVIGDVVNNDGIPMFVHPKLDEMAYISENSSIGSPVFRVVAADPDDPNSPEGQLRFSFLQDGSDSLAFKMDPETGLITTKQPLDREKKDKYSLILVAQDSGAVPQQATRLLTVIVTDIDDHKPHFKRTLDEGPLEFTVEEELPIGSEIGTIEAIDLDIGENAEIGYLITFGNEDGLFSLDRMGNNQAKISVANRLDRETASEHTITVKCFKLSAQPVSLRKQYNRQDTSERQIRIKVSDIDDNLPLFSDNNITIGVRVNVPVDTQLLTLTATDVDADAAPITYHMESMQFSRPLSPLLNGTQFALDSRSGQLLTASQMTPFSDGHFTLRVFANNSDQHTYATIKIFVVRERGLLKFVFGRPPADVRQNLVDFRHDVEKALALSGSLNVYDTQFHSKPDGSLDFSSTSSCFQLVGSQTYDVKEMESMLKDNPKLEDVYTKYIVQSVERCAPVVGRAGITWVQWSVLGIASFIGIASVFAACILCCSYSRWQRFR